MSVIWGTRSVQQEFSFQKQENAFRASLYKNDEKKPEPEASKKPSLREALQQMQVDLRNKKPSFEMKDPNLFRFPDVQPATKPRRLKIAGVIIGN